MKKSEGMTYGVAMGLLFGVGLGGIFDNLALWLGLGIAAGIGVGALLGRRSKE